MNDFERLRINCEEILNTNDKSAQLQVFDMLIGWVQSTAAKKKVSLAQVSQLMESADQLWRSMALRAEPPHKYDPDAFEEWSNRQKVD